MMPCGNKADRKCVRVVLGMGEADCDFVRNLYHHHSYRFRDLVVAREVAKFCFLALNHAPLT
jgi:hypothetical protein